MVQNRMLLCYLITNVAIPKHVKRVTFCGLAVEAQKSRARKIPNQKATIPTTPHLVYLGSP
jgi:hypothetical protein